MTEQRYKNTFDKSKQNVCLHTIKEARDSRQMRVLAAYYFFKKHFSHAILYDYRTRLNDIGQVLGVSGRTMQTYIVRWKAWGLVHEHKFNLVLTSTAKVKRALGERRRYKITTTDNETIQSIEARLYAKLLEEQANRITWYKRQHRFIRKPKRAKSGDTNITDCGESPPAQPVSLSLRNIGKALNVSRFKANEIIQQLNTLGVIITQKNKPRKVCKAPANSIHTTEGLPGYFYSSGGTTYQVFGSLHAFIEYPPNNNNLTYKQFIHLYKKSKHTTKKVIHDIYTMKAAQPLNFQ